MVVVVVDYNSACGMVARCSIARTGWQRLQLHER
jgi:hypothetical protein